MARAGRRQVIFALIRIKPRTVSELQRLLNVARSSVHNHIQTLESDNWIVAKEKTLKIKRTHGDNHYFEYYVSPIVDWCRFCDGGLTEENDMVYCSVCGEPDPALTESSGMDWGRRNEVHVVSKGSD